ncbi:hypothetical protein O6H91_09G020100 [Diphasiastrum complanatum]|uniref:Uncharacterized protein n=2 Tax=Diphasiastrum complanatum TaxID=34168 RepID=A0ACC2CLZ2_DIPCM|nr:hypothetical protein O6H91_09G020100 [Diphasiastrum complanatum]KAJ7542966.1 hypothetical protein O6H91_09G020100 [Diphasiastrum complanatum]
MILTQISRMWKVLVALAFAGLALYLGADPFKLSFIAQFPDFQTLYVEQPTWAAAFSYPKDSHNKLQKADLRFVNEIHGPESIVFDVHGRGPYTGLSDGRIVRWDGAEKGWKDFAYTSPNRSEICQPKIPPQPNVAFEHVCGRPLGLRFSKKTGELFIADAYHGLLVVGPDGGLAKSLATEAEGEPFKFTNDLDLDDEGNVYFTDSSTKFQRRNFFAAIVAGDNTGRLLKYNPSTQETRVLLRGLLFANGVALSKDKSFLIVAESTGSRLQRYWLKGAKAGTAELFALLPGFPDNVRKNEAGEFWVAIYCRRNLRHHILGPRPLLRKLIFKLPIPLKYLPVFYNGKPQGMVLKYSADGVLVDVLEDDTGKVVKFVSEVEERDGKLWLGTVLLPHIAVL